ncbi:repetitive organellar protein-like [Artemia franciscana]|uniref:repetitive organellar protein-like n=1 Tax=Artemia franciscana TaxID=6661 RepID=UPI0032D9EFCE
MDIGNGEKYCESMEMTLDDLEDCDKISEILLDRLEERDNEVSDLRQRIETLEKELSEGKYLIFELKREKEFDKYQFETNLTEKDVHINKQSEMIAKLRTEYDLLEAKCELNLQDNIKDEEIRRLNNELKKWLQIISSYFIGDTPEKFADEIVCLLRDKEALVTECQELHNELALVKNPKKVPDWKRLRRLQEKSHELPLVPNVPQSSDEDSEIGELKKRISSVMDERLMLLEEKIKYEELREKVKCMQSDIEKQEQKVLELSGENQKLNENYMYYKEFFDKVYCEIKGFQGEGLETTTETVSSFLFNLLGQFRELMIQYQGNLKELKLVKQSYSFTLKSLVLFRADLSLACTRNEIRKKKKEAAKTKAGWLMES